MQKTISLFAKLWPACAIALCAVSTFGQTKPASDASEPRCVWSGSTPDGALTVCLLYKDQAPEATIEPEKIEILKQKGSPIFITPGGLIRDWHFWKDSSQIAVTFNGSDGAEARTLYDASTGTIVEKLSKTPADPADLPQWAKNQSELIDESIAESYQLDLERSIWLMKIMEQTMAIRPGMHRRDLDANFKTEGGLSTRTQRQYVSKKCGLVKITVKFKATEINIDDPGFEDPEDVITSVSMPFLQLAIMD